MNKVESIVRHLSKDKITDSDASVNATNASTFTAFTTIAKFGPALIILGFIVMVAIGAFLGIKLGSKGR